MNKIIIEFENISAGWLQIDIYDYRSEEIRKMRVSYLQSFFKDLYMICKFLLSDIEGIFEIPIEQEGFEASFKFYKYEEKTIAVEITEDFFEDEIPYDGSEEEWKKFISGNEDKVPSVLTYFNVEIKEFVSGVILLLGKHRTSYNEGFALTKEEEFTEEQLNELVSLFQKKFLKGE